MRHLAIYLIFIVTLSVGASSQPTDIASTRYSWNLCQGSARPYPTPNKTVVIPDTLHAVMINHVGRHGARYPASSEHVDVLQAAIKKAKACGTLTPVGQQLLQLVEQVRKEVANSWGALDSIGAAEQQGIAERMYAAYSGLFRDGTLVARSSYVPRCVMSMYEFAHKLSELDSKINIDASSGPRYNDILRFFDNNAEVKKYINSTGYEKVLAGETESLIPLSGLERALGSSVTMLDSPDRVALAEYSVLASLSAMGIDCDISEFLTVEEYNALWAAFNFKQYLTHSASALSLAPSKAAKPLLEDIKTSIKIFIANQEHSPKVILRFGHAETMMPLLALMQLPGCYYISDQWDSVASNWHDFDIVPMAANLQIILFKSDTDRYYVRLDLNESPITINKDCDNQYLPVEQFLLL